MQTTSFLPRAGETELPTPPLTLQTLPSVDRLLNLPSLREAAERHGRALVKRVIQQALTDARDQFTRHSRSVTDLNTGLNAELNTELNTAPLNVAITEASLTQAISLQINAELQPRLRRVFNLTGTVIHTNLGRSALPQAAIDALITAARYPVTVEYDLDSAARGERDSLTESHLCALTGAEAATIVNNNAAAVLLTLTALAHAKEVPVSRGELVEIGGSFRIPDIMQVAGCRLIEVGTTNRTHLYDYERAINPQTALLARIYTSNYEVVGFTASVPDAALGQLAKERGVPLMVDLGCGALIPFERYGLPHEPLPQHALRDGANVVTFSGDKLLGGPQSGIIVGDRALIAQIRQHPLKRALRCDKLILGALEAVLRIYRDYLETPDQLAQELPTLRMLVRPPAAIRHCAEACLAPLQAALQTVAEVRLCATRSQIGSGSQPVQRLDSWALVLTPFGKRSGRTVHALEAALRSLPTPVIGRIEDGAVWLDLRTLEDPAEFIAQLANFNIPAGIAT